MTGMLVMSGVLIMPGLLVVHRVLVRDLRPVPVVVVLLVTHCCPTRLGGLREG